MRLSPTFTPDASAIDALCAAHPLALVVSSGPPGLMATPLPLLVEHQDGGRTLLGHYARGNPQGEALQDGAEALVVFQGPHGYISPSWFRDRSQAPTWNYAVVEFTVRIERLPDTDAALAVERLTGAMEHGRPGAWCEQELGARYARLLTAIQPFRARVLATRAKFKLGQNERPDVLADALAGLQDTGHPALVAAMRAANRDRVVTVD